MAGPGILTVDIHGKTRAQARVALNAALRKCDASVFRIRVIHGYNRGTGASGTWCAGSSRAHRGCCAPRPASIPARRSLCCGST